MVYRIALLGVLFLILGLVVPVQAQTVAQPGRESTVKIFNFAPPSGGQMGIGTGTGSAISAQGHVLTNLHVVDGARDLYVVFQGPDGVRYIKAAVVATSQEKDLAVLQAEGLDLPVLPITTDSFDPGTEIIAWGFPGIMDFTDPQGGTNIEERFFSSLELVSRTPGSINKVEPTPWGYPEAFGRVNVVHHTAPISPGNSGGPLVDMCGRLVGVNTAGLIQREMGVTYPMASGADEIIGFLEANSIPFEQKSGACTAGAASGSNDNLLLIAVAFVGVLAVWALVMVYRRPTMMPQAIQEGMSKLIGRPSKRAPVKGEGWMLAGFNGDGYPVRFPIERKHFSDTSWEYVLGRDASLCHGVVEDPEVSRRHLRLVLQGGELCLEDLNSANGTVLDGRPLAPFQPMPLPPGSGIELGKVRLTVTSA